jgi:murein DD-endopeptidase MepM/ murein hydrolase activator NlpD
VSRILLGWAALSALTLARPRTTQGQDSILTISPEPDSAPSLMLDSIPRLEVASDPSLLTEGTVGWLLLRPSRAVRSKVVGGRAAGEPLHFERTAAGEYRGLVGVPIGVRDTFRVAVYLSVEERTDTMIVPVSVRQAGFPTEQLAVAPAFVRPDSASAARIRRELVRSRRVSHRSRETPRLWRGPFRLPRASRITSRFGSARVYNSEVKSRHLGTDFAGAVGAPVHAAGRGVVALVANFYLAGRSIYIDHGHGLVTTYFHLSRVHVREGDTVVAGQRIGRVGQSGRVTGPHLHWAARYGIIPVDPLSLLELEKSPIAEGPREGAEKPGGK